VGHETKESALTAREVVTAIQFNANYWKDPPVTVDGRPVVGVFRSEDGSVGLRLGSTRPPRAARTRAA
jgi:hypothetical protein